MKYLSCFLLVLLMSACLFPKRYLPLQKRIVGEWTISEAYNYTTSLFKTRKQPLEDYIGASLIIYQNRKFNIISPRNQVVHTGHWRITDLGFSVDYRDSTGIKSSTDTKFVIALFAQDGFSILGEVNTFRNTMNIREVIDGKGRYYLLRKKL